MTPVDFTKQLDKQLGFIEASCNGFDNGHRDEAIRIATALRSTLQQNMRSSRLHTR